MPYKEIHVDADKWVEFTKNFCAYHAYKDDDYNDPLIYSFVLSPEEDEENSHDIREWKHYNENKSVEENIHAAFIAGDIYFIRSGDHIGAFVRWDPRDKPSFLQQVFG